MLSKTKPCLKCINISYGRNYDIRRCYSFFKHLKEVKAYEENETFDPDRPIKFSTSPAAKFNIRHIRLETNPVVDAPWSKQFIWSALLMGTVIYLMYYREGNDIDEQLEMPLGKRVLQLKEQIVKQERNQAILQGRSIAIYDADLEEIYKLRKKYNYED